MSASGSRAPLEPRRDRRNRRLLKGLLLAGAAVGVPVLAHALIRRSVQPPQAPRWGRSHRYAGALGPIAFQELGDGDPLVFLHSFGPGHDAAEWRAAAEILAARYRIYVPDLPGWGRSDAPSGALGPSLYVEALDDFLSGVVQESAVVVAAGLPAAYAVEVAAAHPRRVRALALVAPRGLGAEGPAHRTADDPRPFARARRAAVRAVLRVPLLRAGALDLLTSRAALDRHLRNEVYAAPFAVDAGVLDHAYRTAHLPRARAALAAFLRGDLSYDARGSQALAEALERLRIPVWIAWGRDAVSPPVESADLWLHRLARPELEVLAGCGSLPHAEIPAAFSRALSGFLGSLPE
jgi:pimeloyl-ACP methyl ester carboxylesterase